MEGKTICAECARCCRIGPGEEGICFPLFPAEIERISALLGRDDWHTEEANTPGLAEAMARLWPRERELILAWFPKGGTHRRLAVDREGNCLLLGPSGCVLSPADRPGHCRLFPVWVRDGQVVALDAACPIRESARGTARLLAALGLDFASARATCGKLRRDWGLPSESSCTESENEE